jgi:hypothetical protein
MGHERIGFLPKTQSWKHIIDQLAQFNNNPDIVSQIADRTLENIRRQYNNMPYDESVIKALQFLTILSFSAKEKNQENFLMNNGITAMDLSLFTLARCAKRYITTDTGSLEVNKIACDAVLESIAKFEHQNKTDQADLFTENNDNTVWSKIGNGSNFCELARGFFASFTDRYLRYFIEREAAHCIDNFEKLENFKKTLYAQISQHSYEASKIMQSFAAGWFNKYAKSGMPNNDEIKGFLKLSFEKMREEFRREAGKK